MDTTTTCATRAKATTAAKASRARATTKGIDNKGNMKDECDEPDFQYMGAREHAKCKGRRRVGRPNGTTDRERDRVRERLAKRDRRRLAFESTDRERVRHEQVERERGQAIHIRPTHKVRDDLSVRAAREILDPLVAPALAAGYRSPFASSPSGHNARNPLASHIQWQADQARRAITSDDNVGEDDDDEVMESEAVGSPVAGHRRGPTVLPYARACNRVVCASCGGAAGEYNGGRKPRDPNT